MCARVPGHVDYASEALSLNASSLHLLLYPLCPTGLHTFRCGDHWHAGHRKRVDGDACKVAHAGWFRGMPPGDTPT